jgi:hypothetical protein
MADNVTTIDHDAIRQWTEARGGSPARVRLADGGDHIGLLRIAFGQVDGAVQVIPWDVFFEVFEASGLALVHDPDPASRYFRFVRRRAA